MTGLEEKTTTGRPWTVEFTFPTFEQADESRRLLKEQGVPEVKVKRYCDESGRVTFTVRTRRPVAQSTGKSKSKSRSAGKNQ